MRTTSNGVLDSFLTPEAMLTPGAAGALTMMITNALGLNFAAPRAFTVLILSFMFGLLVLVADKALMVKAIFYVLNSLVIFCVANGANGIGVTQQMASLSLISPALAAEVNTADPNDLRSTYKKLSDEYDDLSKKIESARNTSTSKDDVLSLVAKRDEVEKNRQEAFDKMVKATSLRGLRKPSFAPPPSDQMRTPQQ